MTNSSCVKLAATTSHGIWQGDQVLDFSLSLLIIQMILILFITRVVSVLLKPLRQPRVVAEIIGGILLGPSALGRIHSYNTRVFTKQSISILSTFASMGLMFFLFMVGLELDLKSLKRTGKQAIAISAAGVSFPFTAGIGVSLLLHKSINPEARFAPFLVFMGVALSITAFPVLARILAERRLLTTDVGKMAVSAAALNDMVAWIFLALAVALSGTSQSPIAALWILLSGIGFVILMFIFVRPVMNWIANRSPDEQPVEELYVSITLAGVLVAGFLTDFIGIHGIFGAFVFGLIIPEGHFAQSLTKKLEDFVNILMLPLYFAVSGLQTNIGAIHGMRSIGLLLLVILTACGGKILGTVAVSVSYGEKFRNALTLGFLMNTKGLVELIVLNIGRERKVLNEEMFAIMVLMALFTTFLTTPVVMALYKPARESVPYGRRRLTDTNSDNKLRILACIHSMKNIPSVMKVVETTRGSGKHEALKLYIFRLMELTERSSAIMLVQKARRDGFPTSRSPVRNLDTAFVRLNKLLVRTMIGISSIEEMHEDICTTAAKKRVALVILPFHRYAGPEGILETMNPGFQVVNQQVLKHAPCSVGILVDRASQVCLSEDNTVAVLFFGGPDDREALALGLRMAEHPAIKLTVFRFMSSLHSVSIECLTDNESSLSETHLDNEAIENAKHVVEGNKNVFKEVKMTSDDAVENALEIAKGNEHGLFIVGKGSKGMPDKPMTCPELGPIGNQLADVDEHVIRSSVLVVQRYMPPI